MVHRLCFRIGQKVPTPTSHFTNRNIYMWSHLNYFSLRNTNTAEFKGDQYFAISGIWIGSVWLDSARLNTIAERCINRWIRRRRPSKQTNCICISAIPFRTATFSKIVFGTWIAICLPLSLSQSRFRQFYICLACTWSWLFDTPRLASLWIYRHKLMQKVIQTARWKEE